MNIRIRVALWWLSLLLFGYAAIALPVISSRLQMGFNPYLLIIETFLVGAMCCSLSKIRFIAGLDEQGD